MLHEKVRSTAEGWGKMKQAKEDIVTGKGVTGLKRRGDSFLHSPIREKTEGGRKKRTGVAGGALSVSPSKILQGQKIEFYCQKIKINNRIVSTNKKLEE